MSPRNTPRSQRLGEAQSEEVGRLHGDERRARWRGRWNAMRAFWGHIGKKAKRWAAVVGILGTFGKPALWVAKKARALYKARSIAPAELPKTGVRTVATDFVDAPKGGAPQSTSERKP